MARPANEDRIEIREGVYLYLRDSQIWQVYFKLKGSKKAVRRSLGTRNLTEARRLGLEEYDQARLRQKSGKPELGISFSKLCDEYATLTIDANSVVIGMLPTPENNHLDGNHAS